MVAKFLEYWQLREVNGYKCVDQQSNIEHEHGIDGPF